MPKATGLVSKVTEDGHRLSGSPSSVIHTHSHSRSPCEIRRMLSILPRKKVMPESVWRAVFEPQLPRSTAQALTQRTYLEPEEMGGPP